MGVIKTLKHRLLTFLLNKLMLNFCSMNVNNWNDKLIKKSKKLTEAELIVKAEQLKKFNEFRSIAAQMLHKDGLTNFTIDIVDASQPLHQCQLLIHDNTNQNNFELVIVRDKDVGLMMPQLIKKMKELRGGIN